MNSGTLLKEVIMHPYVNTLQTHKHVQIGTAPLNTTTSLTLELPTAVAIAGPKVAPIT